MFSSPGSKCLNLVKNDETGYPLTFCFSFILLRQGFAVSVLVMTRYDPPFVSFPLSYARSLRTFLCCSQELWLHLKISGICIFLTDSVCWEIERVTEEYHLHCLLLNRDLVL